MSTGIQPGANVYTQGFGSRPENVEVPHIDTRAPSTSDFMYPIGKRWIFVGNSEYVLVALSTVGGITSATWDLLGTNSGPLNTLTGNTGGALSPSAGNINIVGSGVISVAGSGSTLTISESPGAGLVSTLTGDSGGPISPTAGNINVDGTANQITTTGSGSTITWSIPSTFIAPGSIASTTTVTAGSGLTVTSGGATVTAGGAAITGTTNINTTGAAVTTLGTGGTGAVHIGNATGNTAVTGSLTASTTLTATLGAITATNGNLVMSTAGNKLIIPATSSATCSAGTFTLAGAATTVVSNSAVTANSLILLTTQALGTVSAASTLAVTAKSANTSFTVTPSQSTDTSTVAYLIIN
jgi:hypothetical protein